MHCAKSSAISVHRWSRAAFERSIAGPRKGLGDSAFNRAWVQGRAMTLEQAIEYALTDQAN